MINQIKESMSIHEIVGGPKGNKNTRHERQGSFFLGYKHIFGEAEIEHMASGADIIEMFYWLADDQ